MSLLDVNQIPLGLQLGELPGGIGGSPIGGGQDTGQPDRPIDCDPPEKPRPPVGAKRLDRN